MRASFSLITSTAVIATLLIGSPSCGLAIVGTSSDADGTSLDGGALLDGAALDGPGAGGQEDAAGERDGSGNVGPDGSSLNDGGGGGGGDSGNDAGLQCGTSMVLVTSAPPAVGPYCIDKVEVTEQRYAMFRAANVPTSSLTPACAAKTAFNSGSARGANRPVSDVDWCDAWAFCKWSGKRLCGVAEWQNACSDGTSVVFPYGNTFNDATCNGGPIGAPVDVGSLAGCHGPIAGLMDMSGNIDEWSAGCSANAGLADLCKTHGGDWQNDASGELMCSSVFDRARNTVAGQIGFRCCK